jgi:adenosine kinase
LPQTTIITLGEAGSEIYMNSTTIKIPTTKAEVVIDPTGAGDAYRGGLLSGLLQGMGIEESALLGSVCASFAVECNGTQVYSFTAADFEKRLQLVKKQ